LARKEKKVTGSVIKKYFKHSNLNPISVRKEIKNNPVLYVNGQCYLMMPMQEFFERIILKAGARARPSDNEFRDSRLKAITEHI
jgi:hypothetical protein